MVTVLFADLVRFTARPERLSFNTVKTHARGIHRKLDASTRDEAIAHARQRGLLPR